MSNNKWQIGESVVVRRSSKQGNVVAANTAENNQGITENVQIQYKDGTSEWMPADKISKLLIEVDPKIDNYREKFLSE